MTPYRAPVEDIAFTLKEVAGFGELVSDGLFGDELSIDLADAILEEAGRYATEELSKLNRAGDEHGAKVKDGEVTTSPGWKEIYNSWAQGGWNALPGPTEYGGQGLPNMLHVSTFEMWDSACLSFGLGPLLTIGAYEAVNAHGSEALKSKYLPKMVSGEWMGTMNLTEPQAGSDLNAIKTRAEPLGDGRYKIYGQKIYITYGEHDLTENIIHLVLARLPDAPAGTKGISLFLVPKFLINDDGSLGARNDIYCNGIEHKLGLHGSPTCTLIYGDGKHGNEQDPGAIGWLVGQENRGLAAMFTMMNNARLAVGVQGVGIAERAYQQALAFANERRQGRAQGTPAGEMAPIIEHPDVKRNLMSMRAQTTLARALCYSCAYAIDRAHKGTKDKEYWANRAALLTPLAKAYSTDVGVDVASIGVQIHGGMGFIEETGAGQHWRDSRILPIYEGTNGIQSIDLVMRKLPLEGGEHIALFFSELGDIIDRVASSNHPDITPLAPKLTNAVNAAKEASQFLLEKLADGDLQTALAGTQPYLRLLSLAAGGVYLAKGALGAARDDAPTPSHKRWLATTRFFVDNLLGETESLKGSVLDGAQSISDISAELLTA